LHDGLGVEIPFTWKAVLLALGAMSFPLLVRTARVAFEAVDPRLEQVARSPGAGPGWVFFRVTMPLAGPGLWAGAILAFARALGEFGATIVLAGNIPGQTTTLALAIYQHVQLGDDGPALRLLVVSVLLAGLAVWGSETLMRRSRASQKVLR
jgi:molybdate transport system permease protein